MQDHQSENLYTQQEEEFSFRKALFSKKDDFLYLLKFKWKIILFGLLGGLFGALVAWQWPKSYTAKLTFVVEESKGGGGGLISSLAGQLGFDLGGLTSGTGGVLAGDNVQQLLISQKIIKEALLTPYSKKDSTYTLADKYVEVYKLDEKWEKVFKVGQIKFPPTQSNYTRLQDSLLHEIMRTISEKEVGVAKPDKKLSFFALTATMKNDELASRFCTNLIAKASSFYIDTKTKSLKTNVERLQHRADSIGRLLNRKTYSSSAATGVLLDANPAFTTAGVASEVQERDKRVLQTIYSEIIKNLEVSRTMLIQETPTFQIVDTPELPLKKNRLKYSSGILVGGLIAGIASCLFFLIIRKPEEN